jgi:hypothetical protein
MRRIQHHEGASFLKVVKSIVTMENESNIIKIRLLTLFKWGNFMSILTKGEWSIYRVHLLQKMFRFLA